MFDNIETINTFSVKLERKTSMYTYKKRLVPWTWAFITARPTFLFIPPSFALTHVLNFCINANRKVSSQIERREKKESADSSVNAMFYFTYFKSSNNRNWSSKLRFETLKSRFPVLWMFGTEKYPSITWYFEQYLLRHKWNYLIWPKYMKNWFLLRWKIAEMWEMLNLEMVMLRSHQQSKGALFSIRFVLSNYERVISVIHRFYVPHTAFLLNSCAQ